MTDDASTAQARILLEQLWNQVNSISTILEDIELRRGRSVGGSAVDTSRESELRRDLYEAHRLIEGIHRRFPETRSDVSSPGNLRRAVR